jgi:D-lactate dehydrogenase
MTKVCFFSARSWDEDSFSKAIASLPKDELKLDFHADRLHRGTAALAKGADVVCLFVNDVADAEVISLLADHGVKLIALRCAGFNNVDLVAAKRSGIRVVRVPAYSPHAVAEHAVGLILALNRHLPRAWNRVRDGNFDLEGLLGFDLNGKTVVVVGTGKIGATFGQIMRGFGCDVLAVDPIVNPECVAAGMRYVSMAEALPQADILSLHCPLVPATRHVINAATLSKLKPGAMLINTGRGALIDTAAVIESLKAKQLGALGLDVYEEESALFFSDLSNEIIPDDVFMRLTTFPNVLITGHQGFFTREALGNIADCTIESICAWKQQAPLACEVTA